MSISCECGASFQVNESLGGASIICPNCKRSLEVPISVESSDSSNSSNSSTSSGSSNSSSSNSSGSWFRKKLGSLWWEFCIYPRRTVPRILNCSGSDEKGLAIAVVSAALLASSKVLYSSSVWAWPSVFPLAISAAFFGFAFSWYLVPLWIHRSGKMFDGQGTLQEIRTVWTWSQLLYIYWFVFTVLTAHFHQGSLFSGSVSDSVSSGISGSISSHISVDVSGNVPGNVPGHALNAARHFSGRPWFGFAGFIFSVWHLAVSTIFISQVQKISKLKAFLNILLGWFFVGLFLLAILLLFVLLLTMLAFFASVNLKTLIHS